MASVSRSGKRLFHHNVLLKLVLPLAFVSCAVSAAMVLVADRSASERPQPDLYARLSLELESRLQTREPSDDAVLSLGPGGRDLRLWGDLAEGTAERVGRMLHANPGIERVHLTSGGGLVEEAQAVGRLIARFGLATYVPDYCVSACTLAFARGRQRFVLSESRVGFHAPYEQGLFGQDFEVDSTEERAAYLAAGIEPAFVETALRVHSNDLWVPDAERLVAAHVATEIVDLDRFPDSGLDDGADLPHARTAILRNFAVLRTLAHTAPGLIDSIAGWYLDAYRRGASEGQTTSGLTGLVTATVLHVLRETDDAAMVAAGGRLLRAMSSAAQPGACAAIGAGADLSQALDDAAEAGDGDRPLPARAVAELERYGALPIEEAGFAVARHRSQASHLDCAASLQRYERALSLPQADAAEAVRKLMFGNEPARRGQEAVAGP